MAHVAITPVAPTRDSSATLAKTASTTATGFTFPCPKSGKFALLVENTGSTSSTLVMWACGAGLHKSQGDLTFNVAVSSSWVFGPLSTSRFKSGTNIHMLVCPSASGVGAAGFTGNLAVIKLP